MVKAYKAYFIDLDGTMYRGQEKIAEATAFVERLDSAGIPYVFITNNATKRPEEVVTHLATVSHLNVKPETVYTSAMAAADYLVAHHYGKRALVIGEQPLKDCLTAQGFTLVDDKPDFVIQSLDRQLTYEKLTAACLAIQQGAPFLVTNNDSNIPTEKGLLPGSGATTAFLQACTKQQPIIIGKPSPWMLTNALKRLALAPEDVLMIGDNFNTDIMAGINAQVDTLLVLTGYTTRDDLANYAQQPTYVADSLMEWGRGA